MDWGILGQLRLKEKLGELEESSESKKRGTRHGNIRSVKVAAGTKPRKLERLPSREDIKAPPAVEGEGPKCKFCDFIVPLRWNNSTDSSGSLISHMKKCNPALFKRIMFENKLDSFSQVPLGIEGGRNG